LELLDSKIEKDKNLKYLERVQKRSGSFSTGKKYYLLNKLFDFLPSEIAEMEGLEGSSSVRQLIIRVSDQLAAGEIKLIEVDPEEEAAAKERLETHRKKRRERHAKKKKIH
jgi:hypothetical protein